MIIYQHLKITILETFVYTIISFMNSKSFPRKYNGKPVQRMTVGWRQLLPALAEGSSVAQTLALKARDIMYCVAIATNSPSGSAGTLGSLFASLHIRKIEAWEFSGNPITLTWGAVAQAGPFTSGPDVTLTDTGSAAVPSHLMMKPKKGSLQDGWLQSNDNSNNIAILTTNPSSGNNTGTYTSNVLLRMSFDYVLNDGSAFTSSSITTSSTANAFHTGDVVWRHLVGGGNTYYSELAPGVATYYP
jgi:hypothetical protein